MNKDRTKKICFVAGILFTIVVAGLLILVHTDEVVRYNVIEVEPKRIPVLVVGDADPGDASGFFYFMIKNHSATPTTDYAVNVTNTTGGNANCYEFSDTVNTSCTGETPHTTTFDIIVKVGITDEDGHNTSGWIEGWNWCLLTCADLSIGADTNMSEIEIGNTTTYAWYHYYLDNTGSGYTITENEAFNITSVKFYVQRIV